MFATELPGLGKRGGWSPGLLYADIDDARAELARLEQEIATIRSRQVRILSWLDAHHVARVESARSTEEWAAAALDIAPATARDLITIARTSTPSSAVHREMGEGAVSFDRAVATDRLVAAGATEADLAECRNRDVSDVRARVAELKRMRRVDEREVMRQRHLTITPTPGNTAWRISGIAPGYEGHLIAKALQERGDGFPSGPDGGREGLGRRMLDALTSLSLDYLDGEAPSDDRHAEGDDVDRNSRPGRLPVERRSGGRRGGSTVTVFLDGATAATTGGELGGAIAAGPRIGPDTLERILCGGSVSLVALDERGMPVSATPRTRHIPPAIRDLVLRRDGGCVVDGCRSRYRLEPHHLDRFADGGSHHPAGLVTLCWYHHHVVIHGNGKRLDPESPPHRRRFLRPGQRAATRAGPFAGP